MIVIGIWQFTTGSGVLGLGLVVVAAIIAIGASWRDYVFSGIQVGKQVREPSIGQGVLTRDATRVYDEIPDAKAQLHIKFVHCYYCGMKMPSDALCCRYCGRQQETA
jgi:hypothetical protein